MIGCTWINRVRKYFTRRSNDFLRNVGHALSSFLGYSISACLAVAYLLLATASLNLSDLVA
jgi:hypothetical protein